MDDWIGKRQEINEYAHDSNDRQRQRDIDRQIKSPLELIEQHTVISMCWPLSNYIRGNDGSSNSSDYSNTMITGARPKGIEKRGSRRVRKGQRDRVYVLLYEECECEFEKISAEKLNGGPLQNSEFARKYDQK